MVLLTARRSILAELLPPAAFRLRCEVCKVILGFRRFRWILIVVLASVDVALQYFVSWSRKYRNVSGNNPERKGVHPE